MKVNDSAIAAEKKLSFQKTEALLKRRKAIVADGVGIFCPTTVVTANQD